MDLLLERQDQIAQLESALAISRREGGQIVQVHGEAGIGKTSLLRRFQQRTAGQARLILGQSENLSTPEPLGSVRDISQALGGKLPGLLANVAPHLDIFAAVLQAIGPRTEGARSEVTVLVFEDVRQGRRAGAVIGDQLPVGMAVMHGVRPEQIKRAGRVAPRFAHAPGGVRRVWFPSKNRGWML